MKIPPVARVGCVDNSDPAFDDPIKRLAIQQPLKAVEDSVNIGSREKPIWNIYKGESKRINPTPSLGFFNQSRIEPSEPLASAFVASPIPAISFDRPAVFTVGTADRDKIMLGVMLGIAHFIFSTPLFLASPTALNSASIFLSQPASDSLLASDRSIVFFLFVSLYSERFHRDSVLPRQGN